MSDADEPAGAEDADALPADGDAEPHRCDYCRLPIPDTPALPVTSDREDVTYEFCSEGCLEAMAEHEHAFTEYHGHRRFDPGVAALRAGLPQGLPRNSFVMLTDLAGTRSEAIQAELVWRALQRGEPVVMLSFLEPPISLIQQFVTLDWNVLPYLESGQFHIIDAFTYRLDDRERMFDRMNDWNQHLSAVAEAAVTTVRDPSETRQLESALDRCLTELEMEDAGIVVIDSLTELGTLVQPVRAYDFVKDVRAEVCKGRFVPVFAGATMTGAPEGEGFPHDMGYIVDGIVELRLNDDLVEDALIKQIRVRKLNNVLAIPEWHSYEYTSGEGIVLFDPHEEIRKSRGEDGEAPDEPDVRDPGPASDAEGG
jgi:KaiC/GvpD/RAD55 family RecA-like ATPase